MERRSVSGSEREAEAARLESEVAEVCGVMNAATGRLVRLIGRVLETESWQGWGITSPSQWVAWKCGVSPARARALVRMARRLGELPETRAAPEAGELCEDQVAVVCRHVPATVDGEAATLARSATVVQLRRVLGSYTFDDHARADDAEPTRLRRRNPAGSASATPTAAHGRWQPSCRRMRARWWSGRSLLPETSCSTPASTTRVPFPRRPT